MGFCRTNLFKRLESSGHAFLLSVERHVLQQLHLHSRHRQRACRCRSAPPTPDVLDSQSYDGDADGDAGDVFERDEDAAWQGRMWKTTSH